MIYVTVGTMVMGFGRLLMAMDALAGELHEEVFMQRGSSAYVPANAAYKDFLTVPEADEMLRKADLVVSHAGMGTIIGALSAGTPIIVVPRRARHKEHFNDHQMEIADAVKGRPGVEVVLDVAGLPDAVKRLMGSKGGFITGMPGAGIISAIEEFLDGVERGKRHHRNPGV